MHISLQQYTFETSNKTKIIFNLLNNTIMEATILTPKDFLKICDIINQLPNNTKVYVWVDGIQVYFDSFFNSKKEAKERIYEAVGTKVYGISIESN